MIIRGVLGFLDQFLCDPNAKQGWHERMVPAILSVPELQIPFVLAHKEGKSALHSLEVPFFANPGSDPTFCMLESLMFVLLHLPGLCIWHLQC